MPVAFDSTTKTLIEIEKFVMQLKQIWVKFHILCYALSFLSFSLIQPHWNCNSMLTVAQTNFIFRSISSNINNNQFGNLSADEIGKFYFIFLWASE